MKSFKVTLLYNNIIIILLLFIYNIIEYNINIILYYIHYIIDNEHGANEHSYKPNIKILSITSRSKNDENRKKCFRLLFLKKTQTSPKADKTLIV